MAIYLIALMCLLNHAGFGGSRVAISLFALELGASQVTLGVLMALYALFPMLMAITVGKLVDRVGARVPMLIGTAGVMAGLLLPAMFPGLPSLYASALLLGSTFHFFFITVHGIAGGIGGPDQRAKNYALVSLGFSAAGFVGPTLAGVAIDHLGHAKTFLMLSSFTVVPLVILAWKGGFLPKGTGTAKDKAETSAFDLWHIPKLRGAFIASGILSSAWDLFQFYMPVYGHGVGLSASAIGVILGVFALATFLVRLVLPWIAKRWSEAEILTGGIFVCAAAFALFPVFQSALMIAVIAFVFGLGAGCGQPMSMSLIFSAAPKGRNSEAAGLRVMVNNVTHLIIPLLFGSVGAAFGYAPVFVSNAALLVGGGLVMRRYATLFRKAPSA